MNVEEYGLEMLKAGTNLSTKSEDDLLNMDAKSFPMGDKNLRIGQVNTVDIDEVLARQTALEQAMEGQNKENNYDLFVLVITNILDSDSVILVVWRTKEKVEQAFNTTLKIIQQL